MFFVVIFGGGGVGFFVCLIFVFVLFCLEKYFSKWFSGA